MEARNDKDMSLALWIFILARVAALNKDVKSVLPADSFRITQLSFTSTVLDNNIFKNIQN